MSNAVSHESESDPWLERKITAHVLSEYDFCKRAGLLAYESTPTDEVEPILRLDYMPHYELREIYAALDQLLSVLWKYIIAIAVIVFVAAVLARTWNSTFRFGGLIACLFLGYCASSVIIKILRLQWIRRRAKRAVADEPSGDAPEDEPVDWWDLRAAGFVSHKPEQTLVDDDLNLHGRPWRILRRGEVSIPVFVRQQSEGHIRTQQRTRIATYTRLLKLSEGVQPPFGIVLDRGTFKGVAVKPTEEDLRRVRQKISGLRNMLQASELHDMLPEPPGNRGICSGCPHGKLRTHVRNQSETKRHGIAVAPYEQFHAKLKVCHSSCGDRFTWLPPHKDSLG